jgi:hypothetical protein
MDSEREKVRLAAAKYLAGFSEGIHYSDIANAVLPTLAPTSSLSPKDVNTALHDDAKKRFKRVGRGKWILE